MYRTIIIDDDKLARKVLTRMIERNFDTLEIVGEADSVESGIVLIKSQQPDLVFLDIEMPDGTGFELIDLLPTINFRLIFTTAYSDYAITAFKYSAFDYIVKPILYESLKSTINRIDQIPPLRGKQQLTVLKDNLERKNGWNDPTIALPEMNGFSIIKVKSILRCEGERNYTRVFFKDKTSVLVSRTLLEFDQLLVPHGFCRIHRSHLVNLDSVVRYLKTDGGVVEMNDKSLLRVSPKYKDELLERLLANRL